MPKEANSTAVNAFNSNHADYDVFRPSFAKELVDPFLVGLGLGQEDKESKTFKFDTSKVILEIAAGTGKLTRNLVENGWDNSTSDNLIIVEPSSGMLTSLRKNFPQIKERNIHNASSYEIPLKDGSVDAVIIAQGFHWFADVESLKEIQRVLKPNGNLGLIWNFDYPSHSQSTKLKEVRYINGNSELFNNVGISSFSDPYELFLAYFEKAPWAFETGRTIYSHDVKVPQYRHAKWRALLESSDNTFFNPISDELFYVYELLVAKDDVWKYWKTRSYITELSEPEQEKVKAVINGVLDKYDESSIKRNGKLVRPMATHAVVVPVKK